MGHYVAIRSRVPVMTPDGKRVLRRGDVVPEGTIQLRRLEMRRCIRFVEDAPAAAAPPKPEPVADDKPQGVVDRVKGAVKKVGKKTPKKRPPKKTESK